MFLVIRKPERGSEIFQFMSVLSHEVWLSIVAILLSTGFFLWFLDKFSPYSARNNKKMYSYPTRYRCKQTKFFKFIQTFDTQIICLDILALKKVFGLLLLPSHLKGVAKRQKHYLVASW